MATARKDAASGLPRMSRRERSQAIRQAIKEVAEEMVRGELATTYKQFLHDVLIARVDVEFARAAPDVARDLLTEGIAGAVRQEITARVLEILKKVHVDVRVQTFVAESPWVPVTAKPLG